MGNNMKYGIIHKDGKIIKWFFRVKKPADFYNAISQFSTGSRDESETIAFLAGCEEKGWIKIKPNDVSMIDWTSL